MRRFHDEMITPDTSGLPDDFFDRFVFNLHPTDATQPSVLLGHGMYPGRNTVDGFAILVTEAEQRNVRWSTELSATDGRTGGPFRFDVVEPNTSWKLTVGPNPVGMELDVTWQARAPYWVGEVEVTNASGAATSFEHLFQSGRYTGTLTIDGSARSVDGWFGQRDRSRGVRTMSGGQGLHVWYQAQFPDRCVGFLLVETRAGGRILLEGAVMHEDGTVDDITHVEHDLRFDDNVDLQDGRVVVRTASGASYDISADASAGGGFMSGGGYGGQHGRPKGRDHLEYDVYPLDGSVHQHTLDSSLTDRLASFDWDGTPGLGVFEFALSRSSSYRYRPTLT